MTSSLGSQSPSAATAASSAPTDSAWCRSGTAAAARERLLWVVSSDAMAAITLAAMANQNAMVRPSLNGWVMTVGKKSRPVR